MRSPPSIRSSSPLLAMCLVLACSYAEPDLVDGTPVSAITSARAAVGNSEAMITWAPRPATDQPAPIRLTGSDGTGLRLVALDTRTVVQDPLAFTELRLTFENPEDRVREGRFEINLPEGAAISRFAMKIGDRWQEGEVVEKQRARRVYEDFLHRGQDPALLEKAPGNKFTARVFPIPAGGVKDLIISWSQELDDSDDGLSLPLGGLPEVDELSVQVNVDYGDGAPSQAFTHKAKGEAPQGDLVVNFGGAVRPVGLRSGEYSVVRVTPDLNVTADPMKKVTFLFDTSASRAPGFADQVRRLTDLMRALPEGVDVRVLAFDQDVAQIYAGRVRKMHVAKITGDLLSREALGASNLQGALEFVAQHPAGHDRLVLVGDGVVTAGDMEVGPLQDAVQSLAKVGYQRVDAIVDGGLRDEQMLRALTRGELDNDGVVLDATLGTPELARRLSLATSGPIQVHVPGAKWVWPRVIQGLQPGDEALVYAVVGDGEPVTVQLDGAVQTDTVRWLDVERPLLERAAVAANLRRLDHDRSTTKDASSKAELTSAIVSLSTRYRILTDDTALLVLETPQDYARYEIPQDALADILTVSAQGGVQLTRRSSAVMPEVVEKKPSRGKSKKAKPVDGRATDGLAQTELVKQERGFANEESDSEARLSLDAAPPPPRAVDVPTAPPSDLRVMEDSEAPMTEDRMVEAPRRRARNGISLGAGRRASSPAVEMGDDSGRDQKLDRIHPWQGRYDDVRRLLDRGNVAGALAEAHAWRAEDPGDVLALVALGEALQASGDLTAAARAFGSLIDLFPGRADMRRMAGERLASLGTVGRTLAIDTWTVATVQRPDHLNGWRLLATAHLADGDAKKAFEVLEAGLMSDGVRARPGVVAVLREDLGLAGAAWIASSPNDRETIVERAQAAEATPPTGPSTRFVLSWETDANDVDLHVWDRKGNHSFYSQRNLKSGGSLLADVTNGYGPELFVMDKADAGPYKLAAHYYSRGPMGYGMGTLQVVTHDGVGGITVEDRPFVVMVDSATVDLGTWGERTASR